MTKLFGSIEVYGTYCFELTLDPSMLPANLFIVDPDTLFSRTRKDENGNEFWDIGQYDEEDNFIVLDPRRVFFDSINPLPTEIKGSSMLAPAFGSVIASNIVSQDYVGVMQNQNYNQRYVTMKTVEMMNAGVPYNKIVDEVENIQQLMTDTNNLTNPTEIPFFGSDVDFKQVSGGNSGLSEAKILDDILDRHIIRGLGKLPAKMGSNEFTAESSATSQSLQESLEIEARQKRVEILVGYALSRMLQNLGIVESAKLALKRVDIVERAMEADIFQKMSTSVNNLSTAGIKPHISLKLFSEMTGTYISKDLIDQVERDSHSIQEPRPNDESTRN